MFTTFWKLIPELHVYPLPKVPMSTYIGRVSFEQISLCYMSQWLETEQTCNGCKIIQDLSIEE